MNDQPMPVSLHDEQAGLAVDHVMPAHAIHTYRYAPLAADAAVVVGAKPQALAQAAANILPAMTTAPGVRVELPGVTASSAGEQAAAGSSMAPLMGLLALMAALGGVAAWRQVAPRAHLAGWEPAELDDGAAAGQHYSEYTDAPARDAA